MILEPGRETERAFVERLLEHVGHRCNFSVVGRARRVRAHDGGAQRAMADHADHVRGDLGLVHCVEQFAVGVPVTPLARSGRRKQRRSVLV